MGKRGNSGVIANLTLVKDSPIPIYKQVYKELRKAIISGRLQGGTRLPATRTLATELSVSRNTVVSVFAELLAEGYVESRIGDGTYVCRTIPEDHLVSNGWGFAPIDPLFSEERLSDRGRQMIQLTAEPSVREVALPRPFCADLPAVDAFPIEAWSRIMTNCWRKITPTALGYVQSEGFEPLQYAIASHLQAARSVNCSAEQIIITSGSQQSLDLVARLMLDRGDTVWFEDPGYIGSRNIFLASGANVLPVTVDDEGMSLEAGKALDPQPKLIYLSPSRQYPLGVTMSERRRRDIIKYANSIGAYIVEDDYDNEFRYDGAPQPSMQGLASPGSIIYLGTFSKSLIPAFRLGYIVAHNELAQSFKAATSLLTRHAPLLEQMTLHEFMGSGQFAAHLRQMRMLYMERRDALISGIERVMGDLIELSPCPTGTGVTAFFREEVDDVAFCDQARHRGISLRPLSIYYWGQKKRSGLILGFASSPVRRINSSIEKLGAFAREFLQLDTTQRPTGKLRAVS